jgi:glutamate synthase (NADPH/NADH) small chain
MDQQELRRLENLCIQECAPWCAATCPVHVDVRAMTAAAAKGDFQAVVQAFRRSVPFPGIISHICDHPCEPVCKRREVGDPIAIRAIERAALTYSVARDIRFPPVPKKTQSVAIVGSGLSGLTAAYDLAKKGYRITVLEAMERIGGNTRNYPEAALPSSVIDNDFEILNKLSVELRLGVEIGPDQSLKDLRPAYDAVYVGPGDAPKQGLGVDIDKYGRIVADPITFETNAPGIFAGGRAVYTFGAYSPITSISHGRRAAISIDRFLQKVSLTASRENEGAYETRLFTSLKGIEAAPRVHMADSASGYTPDEAQHEGARCLQCECMECVKICDYLAQYKGYPKKYVRQIYNNLSIVMGHRHGNKMINSCSVCGLCKEVCPESLHMGEVCKAARATMVDQGKMPPSAHEFALRDMEFSNSDKAAMARGQPGLASSAHLFFPGCQLAGSYPDHVAKTYEYLRDRLEGGVGLMLRCCGAPADWAGRKEMFGKVLNSFRDQWVAMGRPQLILACSSCYAIFKANFPEAQIVSLWEIFDRQGLPQTERALPEGGLAIHDPCTSRHEPRIQESVRAIVNSIGLEVTELPLSRDKTECCGFGGLMYFANRELADKVIDRRIKETSDDMLAYCAVCCDHFHSRGKPTRHLLELIFGDTAPRFRPMTTPDYSRRRDNRVRLKNYLLEELWGENAFEHEGYEQIELIIPDSVRDLMAQRMILVEDLEQVIGWAESAGTKLVQKKTGHFLAHYRPATVTYWVEYSVDKDGVTVHNAYSHRMEILEEPQA